ncbi:helix-turn-helix domain-containing protein [Altererythrobacter sp. MF3-039]|uniref:AraC family transcriptional regulator n=1 Tax=Altererythrobacter sp. MF3-039 TaxID=3252901 RepID=UPI00390C88ED
MPFDLQIALRLMTIGAALMLLVLINSGAVRRPLQIALSGMLLGGACYVFNSSPDLRAPDSIRPLVDLFSITTPFWTWLFSRLLFERAVGKRWLAVLAVVYLASWIMAHFIPGWDYWGFILNHTVSLALLIDVGFTAWSGRADDLIERRRLIRLWLPVLVAVQAGAVLVFELIYGSDNPFPALQLISVTAILALVLFAGSALLRTDPELLVETTRSTSSNPQASDLSPVEIVLKEKLDAAMAAGEYRTPGLTISTLAEKLDTPEHRLRALINQRLGHRNFSAYLNLHRIEEARSILADRSKVDLPVLTIAMDLGYNSLPTFNRAFRELTGSTPTEFRRDSIEQN